MIFDSLDMVVWSHEIGIEVALWGDELLSGLLTSHSRKDDLFCGF